MSGHSKWSQIKRQKGITDAKRGQVFTKIGRELSIAAKEGGGDPSSNFKLRLVIQKAKDANMPTENIERAIKRALGAEAGVALVETTYEGYGPGGTAVLVQAVTDNRNRTSSEVRQLFVRHGGNLGESGCVAWLFDQRGVIVVSAAGEKAEELALSAIDAGAEDFKQDASTLEIYTKPSDLEAVRKVLESKGAEVTSFDVAMVPKNTIALDVKTAEQTIRLLDKLEELDEVQKVFSNAEFPDEVLAKMAS